MSHFGVDILLAALGLQEFGIAALAPGVELLTGRIVGQTGMVGEESDGDIAIVPLDGIPKNLLQFVLVCQKFLRIDVVGTAETVVPLSYLLVPYLAGIVIHAVEPHVTAL